MCDLMIPEGMTEEKWQKEREIYGVEKPKAAPASTAESVTALRMELTAQLDPENFPKDRILH